MKAFLNIFCGCFCWIRAVIFEYNLYPFYFLLLLKNFIYIASVESVDDEGSFEFSPKAEFTSLLYVYITFATDTGVESLFIAQPLKC